MRRRIAALTGLAALTLTVLAACGGNGDGESPAATTAGAAATTEAASGGDTGTTDGGATDGGATNGDTAAGTTAATLALTLDVCAGMPKELLDATVPGLTLDEPTANAGSTGVSCTFRNPDGSVQVLLNAAPAAIVGQGGDAKAYLDRIATQNTRPGSTPAPVADLGDGGLSYADPDGMAMVSGIGSGVVVTVRYKNEASPTYPGSVPAVEALARELFERAVATAG